MFFDHQLKGEPPLPRVAHVELANGQVVADVESATKLVSAALSFTTGTNEDYKTRTWTTRPLTLAGTKVSGEGPPADAQVYFVAVTDERGAMVSSEPRGPSIHAGPSPAVTRLP